MAASPSNVPLEPERLTIPRVRMRWKWSLIALALLLGYGSYQCGTGMYQGWKLSKTAVWHFHEQMNNGQFEAIYQEADPGFTQGGERNMWVKFLGAVHRKLGDAGETNLVNLRVNAETTGTYVTAEFNTKFARGPATETFTWKKDGSALKLHGYNIQSNDLIVE